jgi:hypothetical protein
MQRVKEGPPKPGAPRPPAAAAPDPAAVAAAKPFLEDVVMLDDMPRFVRAAFGVAVPTGGSVGARAVAASLRVFFDTVVATRANAGGKKKGAGGTRDDEDDEDEEEGGGASTSTLPTRHLLTQVAQALARTPEDMALVLYRQADLDGDGTLTVPELTRWMLAQQSASSGGLQAAQRLLLSLDGDGDGTITEAEFRTGIMRNPALLDAFGFLLGTTDVPVGAAPAKVSGSGGGGGGGKGASAAGGRESGATADDASRVAALMRDFDGGADAAAGAAAVGSTFAGAHAFGIGVEEAAADDGRPRRRLTEAERIAVRRRKIIMACQKLQAESNEQAKKMNNLAFAIRPVLDNTKRLIDIQVQQQKVALVVARRMLGDIEAAKNSPRPMTAAARPPSPARRVRPGTSGGDGTEKPKFRR